MEVVKYLLGECHLLDKMIITYAGYFRRAEVEELCRLLYITERLSFNKTVSPNGYTIFNNKNP